jgi:hypothetical protein
MLTRHRLLFIAAALLPLSAQAASESARVYSDGGNIFAERNGTKTQLTKSSHDAEPVLSPDGLTVVFTRKAGSADDDDQFCGDKSKDDELRAISIDGKNERVLLHGRKGEGGRQLCGFRGKQFTSDGHSLYFLTPGWATSGALHVYDMGKQAERFVMPANDVIVLQERAPGQACRPAASLHGVRRQLRLVLALRRRRQEGDRPGQRFRQFRRPRQTGARGMVPVAMRNGQSGAGIDRILKRR